jgi:hypothetical protein
VRISRGSMSYVFEGMFEGESKEAQKQAFESFNDTLRLCLTTHYNADGSPHSQRTKQQAAALMEQVAETMSLLENCSPLIIFDRLLHELLHVPTALLKWNSCRNYWAFKSERYTHVPCLWYTNSALFIVLLQNSVSSFEIVHYYTTNNAHYLYVCVDTLAGSPTSFDNAIKLRHRWLTPTLGSHLCAACPPSSEPACRNARNSFKRPPLCAGSSLPTLHIRDAGVVSCG